MERTARGSCQRWVKIVFHRYLVIRIGKMEGHGPNQADGTHSNRHLSQHVRVGPKGLLPYYYYSMTSTSSVKVKHLLLD